MSTIHRHPLAAALSVALLAFVSANVSAQQTPAAAPPQEPLQATTQEDPVQTPAQSVTELDQVIVTGSRIPRAGFDTLEPAIVIDKEYIESRGLTNVADALNELPGFGAPTTPSGDQNAFGGGVNYVNIFGLGSQRTLTLVNGRRVVSANAPIIFSASSPGVQVDLNTIPTQLVDRIENISVGGAPTYGADAIAGTTNIILERDFEGVEASTTYGVTDRGDGERYNASVLWGNNFADGRGNITLAVSQDNQNGVLASDRDYIRDAYFFAENPNASQMAQNQPGRTTDDGRVDPSVPFNTGLGDGIPNNVLIRDSRNMLYNAGGVLLRPPGFLLNFTGGRLRGLGPAQDAYLQFAPGGNLVPYDPGTNFGTSTASGGDGYNVNETNQITSDLKRKNFSVMGRFAVTDNIEAFFEGMYYKARAIEIVDSAPSNTTTGSGTNSVITFTNAYPLLNAQAQSTLAANNITSFRMGRIHTDLGTTGTESESEMMRGVFGLNGGFELGDRSFSWEATANLGRYESTFDRVQINHQNFVNAINVVRDASGQVVCSPTAVATVFYGPTTTTEYQPVADANCVPLNLFGEGAPSQAAVDYVTDPTRATSLQKQQVYNINATGSLFDLWTGPVSVNAGYEHRRESADFRVDDFLRQGLGREVPIIPVKGEYSTNEVFAETLIPLVDPAKELPFLKRFDLTAKLRRVDSSVNGGFNAYTYGFQWRPFDSLEIRGNKTRSLRAPAITELYTPTAERFTTVTDPCRSSELGNGENPEIRQRNCAAFYQAYGITGTFSPSSSNIRGLQSGDPTLGNETSNSYTIGFVWEPVHNLRFAADYVEVEIDDVISLLSPADVVQSCYDNPEFNAADVNNANQYCSLITRSSDPGQTGNGQITLLEQVYVNGEYFNFTGITGNMVYQMDLGGFGNLNLSASSFNMKRLERNNTGIVVEDLAGQLGFPDKQYSLNVAYSKGRFGANWQTRYTGSVAYDNDDTPESKDILRVEGQWMHNAGLSYRISDQGQLRFAVTNVFDTPPPPAAFGYDVLGRRYSLTAKWNFR